MTLQRQLGIWGVLLGLLIVFLWLMGDILLPFIAGIVLAYFLDPVADALERAGVSRLVATLLIVLSSILLLTLVLILIVPLIGDQVTRFVGGLPRDISFVVDRFDDYAPDWLKDFIAKGEVSLPTTASDLAARASGWIGTLIGSIWTGGLVLFNLGSLLVITPIVTFYLLYDWDRMIATVDGWVPRDHLDTVRAIARDVDTAMAGFIRGQGTVCLILGSFYAVALTVSGLRFGLLIGITAGLLGFIPYVGALVGGAMAILTALVQFWPEWLPILVVAGIFVFGQFVEGNFLSPKLVGNSIGVHPVWVMFALFAFGYLFGFVGVLLAVPLAAAIGVIARFVLRQYMASRLFLGADARTAARRRRSGDA